MSDSRIDADLLDLYCDGSLDGAELDAFERRLGQDPALLEQAELQRRIDGSLRRLFAGAGARVAAVSSGTVGVTHHRGPARWPLALAAMLLLSVAGVWGSLWWFGPTPLERVYRRTVAAGFEPQVVCATDEQFTRWTQQNLGHPLALRDPPTGLQLVGWSYDRTLSSYTCLLLARLDGDEVVVVMDFLRLDRPQPAHGRRGLNVFRRELGGLVLYELSPRGKPVIVDSLVRVAALPDEDE